MKKLKLTDIAPYSGKRVQPFDGIKRYMSTGDLKGHNLSFEDVTYENKPSRADILVGEGDILFAKMTNTNKALQIDKEYDGIIVSTGFSVHRPIEKILNGDYFLQFLKHQEFQRQKNKLCTGAIQSAISNSGIEKILVPVPDYNDQLHIANLLSKAESLIAQRKESIRLLDEFLKSAFLEMFGDIKAKKSHFRWEKLRPYLKAESGKTSKNVIVDYQTDFPIYGGNGINGWSNKPLYRVPIIIAGRVGQQCGVIHTTKEPCWVTDNAIVLSILNKDKLNLTYLATAYSNTPILEKVKRIDLPFINQSMLLDIELPIPPLELQNQFARIVEKTEALKTQYQQSLQELENLYDSLSQKAFRGELNIKDESLLMAAEPVVNYSK